IITIKTAQNMPIFSFLRANFREMRYSRFFRKIDAEIDETGRLPLDFDLSVFFTRPRLLTDRRNAGPTGERLNSFAANSSQSLYRHLEMREVCAQLFSAGCGSAW